MTNPIAELPLWIECAGASRRAATLQVFAPQWSDETQQEARCALMINGYWDRPRASAGIHRYQALKLALDMAEAILASDSALSQRYSEDE